MPTVSEDAASTCVTATEAMRLFGFKGLESEDLGTGIASLAHKLSTMGDQATAEAPREQAPSERCEEAAGRTHKE